MTTKKQLQDALAAERRNTRSAERHVIRMNEMLTKELAAERKISKSHLGAFTAQFVRANKIEQQLLQAQAAIYNVLRRSNSDIFPEWIRGQLEPLDQSLLDAHDKKIRDEAYAAGAIDQRKGYEQARKPLVDALKQIGQRDPAWAQKIYNVLNNLNQ